MWWLLVGAVLLLGFIDSIHSAWQQLGGRLYTILNPYEWWDTAAVAMLTIHAAWALMLLRRADQGPNWEALRHDLECVPGGLDLIRHALLGRRWVLTTTALFAFEMVLQWQISATLGEGVAIFLFPFMLASLIVDDAAQRLRLLGRLPLDQAMMVRVICCFAAAFAWQLCGGIFFCALVLLVLVLYLRTAANTEWPLTTDPAADHQP